MTHTAGQNDKRTGTPHSRRRRRAALLIFTLGVLAVLIAAGLTLVGPIKKSPCAGRQWKDADEYFACKFPPPPIGRWHAVYTKEFAQAHNLPPAHISTDLSPGVAYMEMDVQPYANGLTACLVNMLIEKPNDVAVYNSYGKEWPWSGVLHARRKLTHFIDLEEYKNNLRRITTFGLAPRNMQYDSKKHMERVVLLLSTRMEF